MRLGKTKNPQPHQAVDFTIIHRITLHGRVLEHNRQVSWLTIITLRTFPAVASGIPAIVLLFTVAGPLRSLT
jgi:hypothetical protein